MSVTGEGLDHSMGIWTLGGGGGCGVLAETMFYVPAENKPNSGTRISFQTCCAFHSPICLCFYMKK